MVAIVFLIVFRSWSFFPALVITSEKRALAQDPNISCGSVAVVQGSAEETNFQVGV